MCIHHYNTYITFCRNPSRARAGPTDVHYSKTTTTNNNNILWPRQLVWSSGVEGWNIFSSKLLWKSCRPDRRTGRPRNVSGRLETLQRLRSGFRVGTCLFSYNKYTFFIMYYYKRGNIASKMFRQTRQLPVVLAKYPFAKRRSKSTDVFVAFRVDANEWMATTWRRYYIIVVLRLYRNAEQRLSVYGPCGRNATHRRMRIREGL